VDEISCTIDDFGPLPVVRPQTPEEVGELVRRAVAESKALYPLGGRTQLGLGPPPERRGYGVDLSALTRVIDYPARDMTITVQAGITIDKLRQILAKEKQQLPIDVPRGGDATLGGSIAANISGCRRYGFGTLRDYVIGITTVNDEGQQTQAGGRVVKNVAGYDLCKLHIGALGTLGIITQVTLKLRPLPEARALVTLGCSRKLLPDLLNGLHATRGRPVCIEVFNHAAAWSLARRAAFPMPDTAWTVIVGFQDSEPRLLWQVRQLMLEIDAAEVVGLQVLGGRASDGLWTALTEAPLRPDACMTFKANLLSSHTAEFCERALEIAPALELHAHAGSGIVWGHVSAGLPASQAKPSPPSLTPQQAADMLKKLTAAVGPHGNVIVTHCPPSWKPLLPVWGKARGDNELMRRVIARFDPRRAFNPGRFLNSNEA
jgi:glycolate oxidase FAD binding subunit